jgi:ATP-dependent protease HslVU (ClpYQ) peptidase subunit
MTAVVGILNKQAVAIAADSAVTIGGANGRKIFNRANKVEIPDHEYPPFLFM